MTYRNVLVGTDGSETASIAVRQAAQLARAFDARLWIVTAFTPRPDPNVDLGEVPDELRWRVTDSGAAEARVAEAKAIAREVGVTDVGGRVEQGDPASVLVTTAQETNTDVIVVGSKGMASPTRFVLGSVPNKVSHHAPCDVIIVHTA